MARRHSPNRHLSTPRLARRNYHSRHLPNPFRSHQSLKGSIPNASTSSHAIGASTTLSSTDPLRPVLVTLHPNLRRLPTRLLLAQKESMRVSGQPTTHAGAKRKRVVASNEN